MRKWEIGLNDARNGFERLPVDAAPQPDGSYLYEPINFEQALGHWESLDAYWSAGAYEYMIKRLDETHLG